MAAGFAYTWHSNRATEDKLAAGPSCQSPCPRYGCLDLGGRLDRALFVGSVRPLSISTKLFPSIAASANAVYFCHGQGFRRNLFHVFHIDNGRAEPAVELEFFEQMQVREGPVFGPFNLDVYLACCVDVAVGAFGI